MYVSSTHLVNKSSFKRTQTFQPSMRNYARLANITLGDLWFSAHNQYHGTIFRCSTYDTDVLALNAMCQTFVDEARERILHGGVD